MKKKRKLLTISIELVVFLLPEREEFKLIEQNEMLKIVTPMMEHVCDHLCRFPWEIERKEDLEEVCAGCQIDQYTNSILNQYDKINYFEKTQCAHLLKELAIEQAAHENMVANWKWHIRERFSRLN